jgi:acyl carrier protein
VPPAVVLEAERFAALLRAERASVLFQTTALLKQNAAACAGIYAGLRYLMFGGEVADAGVVRGVLRDGAPGSLLHIYGPTETTCFVTWQAVDSVPEGATTLPIGRPIAGTRVHILNARLQPVPLGVAGEIHVSGAGVALGYLNRPELTAERFLPDVSDDGSHARMYKTGDLGCWRADGAIEYLGRNDEQVKIRGFRIELGEVQAQLSSHAQVRDAIVIAREDIPGEKRLVAYFVPQHADQCPSLESLRAHLLAMLPDYMVPSAFVSLEKLPLSATGKVDRRALPVPDSGAFTSRAYTAPSGDLECMLAEIWGEVLRVQRVGRDDDFFALGGHSLLAMQCIVRLRSQLSLELPVRTLFDFPTVRQLATQLEGLRDARLRENLAEGGCDVEELVEQVATMSESRVQELIHQLRMEGRS